MRIGMNFTQATREIKVKQCDINNLNILAQEWIAYCFENLLLIPRDERINTWSVATTAFTIRCLKRWKWLPVRHDNNEFSRVHSLINFLPGDTGGFPFTTYKLITAFAVSTLRECFGDTNEIYPSLPTWDNTMEKLAEKDHTILADAVEDAGYQIPEVLSHLRSKCNHEPVCWAVLYLSGKHPFLSKVSFLHFHK